MTRWLAFAVAVLSAAALPPVTRAGDPVPKAEVARRAKPATVLVDAKPRFGTGFCVHPAGLFVTNNHVVAGVPDGRTVTLVLNAGQADQKLLKATVERRDAGRDLALLRADGADKLPTLPLGDDDKLSELDEVISFGFPFGSDLTRNDAYPTVSVNASSISSFRRDRAGILTRIQVDGALNPGNSGGPMVGRDGRVVGVVVSGIPGAGINMAVPVSHVRTFLEKPVVALTAPAIAPADAGRPAEFRAVVASPLAPDEAFEVELVLSAGDGERRFPMTADAGRYVARAAPFGDAKAARPRVELRTADGVLAAPVEDAAFTVAGKPYTLGRVRAVRFGADPQVTLSDGRTVGGAVAGLDAVTVALGDQRVAVKTAGATELVVLPAAAGRTSYTCAVVAKVRGKEVARAETKQVLAGTEAGGADALLKGTFVKPPAAAKPASYVKLVSTSGDYIGQGKSYSYEAKDMTVGSNHSGGVTVRLGGAAGGFTLDVCAPKGDVLKAGEYPGAKRFPFHDASPGLNLSGQGRGSNRLTGKFVVWELEMNGDDVTKCAIDFVQNSEGGPAPLVGVVRFNSSFE